jgi:hypothetical protein
MRGPMYWVYVLEVTELRLAVVKVTVTRIGLLARGYYCACVILKTLMMVRVANVSL